MAFWNPQLKLTVHETFWKMPCQQMFINSSWRSLALCYEQFVLREWIVIGECSLCLDHNAIDAGPSLLVLILKLNSFKWKEALCHCCYLPKKWLISSWNIVFYVLVNWSIKAKRRKTTGTGRMRHLKVLHRRFKNGFREGTEAKSQKKKSGAAPASSASSQWRKVHVIKLFSSNNENVVWPLI